MQKDLEVSEVLTDGGTLIAGNGSAMAEVSETGAAQPVFSLAYELVSVLTVVLGNIELAKKTMKDAKAQRRLSLAQEAAEKAVSIADRLLAASQERASARS